MSLIHEAIRSILISDATVYGLVAGRVFPSIVPQGQALPAVTYHRISALRAYSHDGPSDWARPRYQIASHAITHTAARTLDEAIRQALDGYKGTVLSIPIYATFCVDQRTQYNPATPEGAQFFTVQSDYMIHHKEI